MTTRDGLSVLRVQPFADAVTKLEDLLAQSGRAFLLGAGCSKCAGLPLTAELTDEVLNSGAIDDTSTLVLTAIRDQFEGASGANIEDYLSEIIDLLASANRRAARGAANAVVSLGGGGYDQARLQTAADQIKQGIAAAIDKKKVAIRTHRDFVRAVHRPLRPGKPSSGHVVEYLVLNYDTLLEDALALERIPYADGLDGGAVAWWNPATFDRDGLAARVLKLHGSIDWVELGDHPLPRRIGRSLELEEAGDRRFIIWPALTKYRETQLDPYAQLAERARRVLRPSQGLQRVLVVCGYGFGDTHINLELDRALRESARDLTVVAFTSDNEPAGQLKQWHTDPAVTDQVLVYANRGFFHGKQVTQATEDLSWWRFEVIARLLGGER
jgi:hypothetical protein